MIEYKTVKVNQDIAHKITCDICKKSYAIDSSEMGEAIEAQEFNHIRFTGGYGSIFGDMGEFECDICQHCLKITLGDYIREIDCEDDDETSEDDHEEDAL